MDQNSGPYQFLKYNQHVRHRASTHIGNNYIDEIPIWRFSGGRVEYITVNLSRALCGIINEILVNAIDQYVRTPYEPVSNGGPVTRIDIDFDNKTGRISIANDGRGFDIYTHHQLGGRYSVEGLITQEYSSSNFDDKQDYERVTGGINGVGLKIVNAWSETFEISTVDYPRRLYYHQVCRSDGENISAEKPKVRKLRNGEKARTRISFVPYYAGLCKTHSGAEDNFAWKNAENMAQLGDFIKMRAFQTALFVGQIKYRYEKNQRIEYSNPARIYFNGENISTLDIRRVAALFNTGPPVMIKLESSDNKIAFPWYLTVAVNIHKIPAQGMSIVNGIYLENGGKHISAALAAIRAALRPRIDELRKNRKADITEKSFNELIFLIDCCQMPIPSFGGGNTKISVNLTQKEYNQLKRNFNLTQHDIDALWKILRDPIEYTLFHRDLASSTKKAKPRHIRKYKPAELTKDKRRNTPPQCYLFIPEGDSAEDQVRAIISHPDTPISKKYYGTYNIQGVPPNALRKSREITIDGHKRILQDALLQENISFQGLVNAVGLDFNAQYYYGPDAKLRQQGDVEFSKLNYRAIIAATDQDLDGIGNICSLILVFILRFWPDLIKRDFFKRLQTPIIRVYMGQNVRNFYSERDYDNWCQAQFGGTDHVPRGYKVKYYKGLSGHSEEEIIQDVGRNIEANIISIKWTEDVPQVMEQFYSENSGPRKKILTDPKIPYYSAEALKKRAVAASDHFNIESKQFQLEFMNRKMPHAIDGYGPAQRKAFAAARIHPGEQKVFQLTGYATARMKYPYGDASMHSTIIKMAQHFPGSNVIPPFTAISNGFGSRVKGRARTGQPRYISLKYNPIMDLIYPREDDCLLDYVFEEGDRCEPVYYVPVIPMSIAKTSTTTGAGWQIMIWARDMEFLFKQIRAMINGELNTPTLSMRPHHHGSMKIVYGATPRGKHSGEICLGSYYMDKETNSIHITELPLKIWSYNFECALMGRNPKNDSMEDKFGKPYPHRAMVADVIDNTGGDRVDITVKFVPGGLDKIWEENSGYGNEIIDPVEDYLSMYQPMHEQINMICCEGCIREFSSYDEVLRYWFEVRKNLYEKRLQRQIILLEIKIKVSENIVRFAQLCREGKISIDYNLEDHDRWAELGKNGIMRINTAIYNDPGYTPVDKLRAYIIEKDTDYNYIDNLTTGQRSARQINILREKIDKYKKRLQELRKQTWQRLWLAELDEIEKKYRIGISTSWKYEKRKHIFKQ